uniref:Uncharacterized protein n=1 Tax=Anopheles culicifacies TaxID=139723 RepID=A0A182MQ53_9DIPT
MNRLAREGGRAGRPAGQSNYSSMPGTMVEKPASTWVRQHERGDVADVIDGDVAAQRRLGLDELQDGREVLDAAGGQRLDRAGRDAVGADAARAQRGGQVAHAGFERGLGQAHGVVVGHHAFGAQVGQRQHRAVAAFHQRQRGLGHGGETVGRDVVGDAEAFARQAVQEVAGDGFARSETDRVHQAVQAVPALGQVGEGGFDLAVFGDVAGQHDVAAEFGGEFGHAVLEAVTDVGEGQFGALLVAGARDAVGDGAVGKHPGDQDAFAGEKAHV